MTTKIKNQLNYWLPANLNLSELSSGLENKWRLPKGQAKLKYLVSYITYYHFQYEELEYIGVPYSRVGRIIKPKYTKAGLQTLVNLGIIEKDPTCISSTKALQEGVAYRYKLTEQYLTSPISYEPITDSTQIDNITENSFTSNPSNEYERWLLKNVELITENFNEEEALKITNAINSKEERKRGFYNTKIVEVVNRDLHFSRPNNGRVYTTITNLPKALRSCLQYEEELVEIDWCSLQPFLLINRFIKYNEKIGDSVIEGEILKLVELYNNNQFYTSLKGDYTKKDIKGNYIEVSEKVVFQSQIVSHRDIWKGDFKMRTKLQELFPAFFSFINQLRIKYKGKLAAELQKEESNLIIDKIGLEVFTNNNRVLFVTIHDAIITALGDKDYILGLINRYVRDYKIEYKIKINKLTKFRGYIYTVPPFDALSHNPRFSGETRNEQVTVSDQKQYHLLENKDKSSTTFSDNIDSIEKKAVPPFEELKAVPPFEELPVEPNLDFESDKHLTDLRKELLVTTDEEEIRVLNELIKSRIKTLSRNESK